MWKIKNNFLKFLYWHIFMRARYFIFYNPIFPDDKMQFIQNGCSISIVAKIAIAYKSKILKNNQYYKFWIYLFINYSLIRNQKTLNKKLKSPDIISKTKHFINPISLLPKPLALQTFRFQCTNRLPSKGNINFNLPIWQTKNYCDWAKQFQLGLWPNFVW